MKRISLFVLLLVMTCAAVATAAEPQPLSFTGRFADQKSVAREEFPILDLTAIAAEDALRASTGGPARFAIDRSTDLKTAINGTWEQAGSTSIWRLHIVAGKNTASLNFGFTKYHMPPSAKLYIYDSEHRYVAGPYGEEHNPTGQLWTPIIASHDVFIELDVATSERDQVALVLGQVNQGYRGLGTHSKGYQQPDFGQPKLAGTCSPKQINSGTCNMDVACLAPGDPWNDPRRAVAAITVNGSDTCTGSLVNNTANDHRMLFITASHCSIGTGNDQAVVVYWNYEWPTCRTPGSGASGQSNPPDPNITSSGSTWLTGTPSPFGSCSGGSCTDVTLIEFNQPADPAWNLFWEGWDRRTLGAVCQESSDPTSTAGLCASIHHPNVDEKRITFVAQDLSTSGISGGSNTHWHAMWDPSPPILPNIPSPQPTSLPPGVTEPGSSGSPLFTSEQRLVGVLSGGASHCGATGADLSDEYGQLAVAWDYGTAPTRVGDFLDPLATGALYIDGIGTSPFGIELDPANLAVCQSDASASITVDVTQLEAGFTDLVSLSASGEPPGSNVSFSPSAVAPPGSSSFTLGSPASVTPGSYSVLVTGTAGTTTVDKTLMLGVNDVVPGTVSLTAPADQALNASTTPTLEWSAAATGGPDQYLVEVATDATFSNLVFSQTVDDATSVNVQPELALLTTYYWRVTASNACGSAASSAVYSFTTQTGPGMCTPPTQQVTYFGDDVENGDNGWTTTGSTGASTWQRNTARPNSGSYAWFAADIASVSDQRLTSPAIALPAGENPLTLHFETWREIEQAGTGCYDGGVLEVSIDGGPFQQVPGSAILEGGGYRGIVDDGFSNPLAGQPAWCSEPARPYGDGTVLVDLSGHAGSTLQLRYRLGSDSSASREGWYIDDISVTGCQMAPNDLIFADGFELQTGP